MNFFLLTNCLNFKGCFTQCKFLILENYEKQFLLYGTGGGGQIRNCTPLSKRGVHLHSCTPPLVTGLTGDALMVTSQKMFFWTLPPGLLPNNIKIDSYLCLLRPQHPTPYSVLASLVGPKPCPSIAAVLGPYLACTSHNPWVRHLLL